MQIQLNVLTANGYTVVICFKFSNFAYANTVFNLFATSYEFVVICFKFSNFAYANTVKPPRMPS